MDRFEAKLTYISMRGCLNVDIVLERFSVIVALDYVNTRLISWSDLFY